MFRRTCIICLIVLATAIRTNAEWVKLKDGERLKGQWVQVKGGSLIFNSEGIGRVTLPLGKVASFSTASPAVVLLKNGKSARGAISYSPSGKWSVTRASGSRQIESADIAEILTEQDYSRRLAAEHIRLWQAWKGAASAGYSLQHGAENAHSISFNANATRSRPEEPGFRSPWRTDASLTMLFASTTQAGIQISSNTLSTSLRQNYLFKPNDFVFVMGQADHIQSENLYLRQTYGGGIGRDVIRRPNLAWSVLGGLTFVNEKFSGAPAGQLAEALVGEKASVGILKGVQLTHHLNFYTNLSNAGQYRFDTSAALKLRLMARLTANIGATDFYTSHVIPGPPITVIGPGGNLIFLTAPATKNNFAFTTGFGFNF
jgi:hypothetical protein